MTNRFLTDNRATPATRAATRLVGTARRTGIPLRILVPIALLLCCAPVFAQTTCVKVKVQIEQELTFERVAFVARLLLTNTLPDQALTNVGASLVITDGNGDPADALFFATTPDLQDITAADGTGRIEPGATGDIAWLIIPTVGAGGDDPAGQVYYVGVDLALGPEGQSPVVIPVLPDSITVHPQPRLRLEYFFPRVVYGDNPLTENVEEPVEPFVFGLRVRNDGAGAAGNLRLKTGQPRIVDNEKGLLISFLILANQVNGQAKSPSLLADVGSLAPFATAMIRWTMTASLLGEFIDFKATYEHADEFGGEKTSLIDSISTRSLTHNVLVDTPGSDSILDFLADSDGDEEVLPDFIFASDGTDIPVASVGSNVSNPVTNAQPNTTLTFTPGGSGWVYTRIADPSAGQLQLVQVRRSDNKILPPENAWTDRLVVQRSPLQTAWFFHLADSSSTGQYTLSYRMKPTLDDPGAKAVLAGGDLDFTLTSTVAPSLTATYSMSFANGLPPSPSPTLDPATGAFHWSPVTAQIGQYSATFTVNDGGIPPLTDSKTIQINVDNPNLIVDAGPDRAALPGQQVTLDASGSQGPSPLDFTWSQTEGPPVVLYQPKTATPYFNAPKVTENTVIVWELTLKDGQDREGTDSVTVVVAIAPPVADAGADQSVGAGEVTHLDGGASTGVALTYAWEQIEGLAVSLENDDTATPQFTAPVRTVSSTLRFRLTVTDNLGLTATDTVQITVRAAPLPPTPTPLSYDGMLIQ